MMTTGTISRSTRWVAAQKSGSDTWRAVTAQVEPLSGARAPTPVSSPVTPCGGAFYVKCDQDTNAGRTGLSFVVGLALTRPGEFVAFRFDHDADECRVTELAWQPGLGLAG